MPGFCHRQVCWSTYADLPLFKRSQLAEFLSTKKESVLSFGCVKYSRQDLQSIRRSTFVHPTKFWDFSIFVQSQGLTLCTCGFVTHKNRHVQFPPAMWDWLISKPRVFQHIMGIELPSANADLTDLISLLFPSGFTQMLTVQVCASLTSSLSALLLLLYELFREKHSFTKKLVLSAVVLSQLVTFVTSVMLACKCKCPSSDDLRNLLEAFVNLSDDDLDRIMQWTTPTETGTVNANAASFSPQAYVKLFCMGLGTILCISFVRGNRSEVRENVKFAKECMTELKFASLIKSWMTDLKDTTNWISKEFFGYDMERDQEFYKRYSATLISIQAFHATSPTLFNVFRELKRDYLLECDKFADLYKQVITRKELADIRADAGRLSDRIVAFKQQLATVELQKLPRIHAPCFHLWGHTQVGKSHFLMNYAARRVAEILHIDPEIYHMTLTSEAKYFPPYSGEFFAINDELGLDGKKDIIMGDLCKILSTTPYTAEGADVPHKTQDLRFGLFLASSNNARPKLPDHFELENKIATYGRLISFEARRKTDSQGAPLPHSADYSHMEFRSHVWDETTLRQTNSFDCTAHTIGPWITPDQLVTSMVEATKTALNKWLTALRTRHINECLLPVEIADRNLKKVDVQMAKMLGIQTMAPNPNWSHALTTEFQANTSWLTGVLANSGSKLVINIHGESGIGKTYTANRIAESISAWFHMPHLKDLTIDTIPDRPFVYIFDDPVEKTYQSQLDFMHFFDSIPQRSCLIVTTNIVPVSRKTWTWTLKTKEYIDLRECEPGLPRRLGFCGNIQVNNGTKDSMIFCSPEDNIMIGQNNQSEYLLYHADGATLWTTSIPYSQLEASILGRFHHFLKRESQVQPRYVSADEVPDTADVVMRAPSLSVLRDTTRSYTRLLSALGSNGPTSIIVSDQFSQDFVVPITPSLFRMPQELNDESALEVGMGFFVILRQAMTKFSILLNINGKKFYFSDETILVGGESSPLTVDQHEGTVQINKGLQSVIMHRSDLQSLLVDGASSITRTQLSSLSKMGVRLRDLQSHPSLQDMIQAGQQVSSTYTSRLNMVRQHNSIRQWMRDHPVLSVVGSFVIAASATHIVGKLLDYFVFAEKTPVFPPVETPVPTEWVDANARRLEKATSGQSDDVKSQPKSSKAQVAQSWTTLSQPQANGKILSEGIVLNENAVQMEDSELTDYRIECKVLSNIGAIEPLSMKALGIFKNFIICPAHSTTAGPVSFKFRGKIYDTKVRMVCPSRDIAVLEVDTNVTLFKDLRKYFPDKGHFGYISHFRFVKNQQEGSDIRTLHIEGPAQIMMQESIRYDNFSGCGSDGPYAKVDFIACKKIPSFGDCGYPYFVSTKNPSKCLAGIHIANMVNTPMESPYSYGYCAILSSEDMEHITSYLGGVTNGPKANSLLPYEVCTILKDENDVPLHRMPIVLDDYFRRTVIISDTFSTNPQPVENFTTVGKPVHSMAYTSGKSTIRRSVGSHNIESTFPVRLYPAEHIIRDIENYAGKLKLCWSSYGPNIGLTAISKYGQHPPFVISDEINELLDVVDFWRDKSIFRPALNRVKLTELRPLSLMEVINGYDYEHWKLEPMERRAKAGIFATYQELWINGVAHNRPKSAYLQYIGGEHSRWVMADNPVAKEIFVRYKKRCALALEGKRLYTVVKDCLKDEKLKPKKLARVFNAFDMDVVMFVRRYTGQFVAMYNTLRESSDIAVGLDPFKDWTAISGLFTSSTTAYWFGESGDFANMDGLISPDMIRRFFRNMASYYPPELGPVFEVIADEMIDTIHQFGDCIYFKHQGNPSGNPNTTALNTEIGLQAHYVVCYFLLRPIIDIMDTLHGDPMKRMDYDPDIAYLPPHVLKHYAFYRFLTDIRDVMRGFGYGDDQIWALSSTITSSDPNNSLYTLPKKAELLRKYFGMDYGWDSKDGNDLPLKPISELTFLSRGLVVAGNSVLCPLKTITIEGLLHWTSNDTIEQYIANWDVALLEAAQHGMKYFIMISCAITEITNYLEKIGRLLPKQYVQKTYAEIMEDYYRQSKPVWKWIRSPPGQHMRLTSIFESSEDEDDHSQQILLSTTASRTLRKVNANCGIPVLPEIYMVKRWFPNASGYLCVNDHLMNILSDGNPFFLFPQGIGKAVYSSDGESTGYLYVRDELFNNKNCECQKVSWKGDEDRPARVFQPDSLKYLAECKFSTLSITLRNNDRECDLYNQIQTIFPKVH